MSKALKVGQVAYSVGFVFEDMVCAQVRRIAAIKEGKVCFEGAPVWYPSNQVFTTRKDADRHIKKCLDQAEKSLVDVISTAQRCVTYS